MSSNDNCIEENKKTFKKKIKLKYESISIIGIIFIAFLVFFSLFYMFFVPKITLDGKTYLKIEYGESFNEPGYSASYLGKDITDKVWINGKVDTTKVGIYDIKYKVRKNKITTTKTRKVEIVDTVKPVITLSGEKNVNVCPTYDFEESGYNAFDNYDGNLTDKVKVDIKDDVVTYTVSDSSGNKATVTRKINRVDNEAPIITLKGGDNYYITEKAEYSDPGYTASDNCEGDLTEKVKVSGEVDSNVVGKYYIDYSVSDSKGNSTKVTRTVIVSKEIQTSSPIKGAIYLTFDDGPSSTITSKLLDILKEKNVKATFFVINHSSNLDYLIKREYDEGHTVALHSYSHNYSNVYSSVDSYFNDLNQISDKVEKITGMKSNIIRFPGGGSNTVSRNYSKGIMSILTKEVLNRGYHYFDWNVSSNDAGGAKTSEEVYNNVVKNLSKNRANVVLMHDFENNYKTLNAISDIIDYGKENGYQFLAIDMSTSMVRHSVNN